MKKKKFGVSITPYDGGWWVTDGSWWVTDGGWWVTDGSWRVTAGVTCRHKTDQKKKEAKHSPGGNMQT